jgi:hypothetical protein
MKTQNITFNISKKRGTQKWPKNPSNRWFASISVDPVSQKRNFLGWSQGIFQKNEFRRLWSKSLG